MGGKEGLTGATSIDNILDENAAGAWDTGEDAWPRVDKGMDQYLSDRFAELDFVATLTETERKAGDHNA